MNLDPTTMQFSLKLLAALVAGFAIGAERESRGKPAGISTNSFVIGGAMMFAFISQLADPSSPARIAAQIVSGVGFLGAGIILKSDKGGVTNLTTAASIWFSASIGIALGFGYYLVAALATLYAIVVPRIPHISRLNQDR